MTRCNSNGFFNDWLVSQPFTVLSGAKVELDARSWESVNSVLPSGCPKVSVYVSESNPADVKSFTQVGASTTLNLFDPEQGWTHLSYDLSAYAGKKVYVAIQATTTESLGGFYDNVEFIHMTNSSNRGDVNGDELVNVTDVTALVAYLNSQATYDKNACDVNGDGLVNISDVTTLINILLKK